MRRFFCLIAFCLCLIIPCIGCGVESNTGEAIWQDPNNVVLLWEAEPNCTYIIYRSEQKQGDFKEIGTSQTGSFRDDEAEYPNKYYYKIKKKESKGAESWFSGTILPVKDPKRIASVNVIMYHNFITEEDQAAGVLFDEYSIHPSEFEEDLIWLRDHGYVTITSEELLQHLKGERALPKKAVILSIDDGSYGVYQNAWPLLKKYNMKADFNVIGARIDEAWENLNGGGSRDGEEAPYCTWEELVEMSESGEINLCSHTYGLHVYRSDGRIGMSMMDGESPEAFAKVVEDDYRLALRCMEGWTGKAPHTVAYPYSKRSEQADELVLENTGYQILMAGDGARGTEGNYFVKGCDLSQQLTLMSRPCRMEGTSIGAYLNRIAEKDRENGVNQSDDYLSREGIDKIAKDYPIFDDVKGDDWFSGNVYYAYLNSLMKGVSERNFAPEEPINRGMAVTLLHRLSESPKAETSLVFPDTNAEAWWQNAARWGEESGVLGAMEDGRYYPEESISRQEIAQALYQCGAYLEMDMSGKADITGFTDFQKIDSKYIGAVEWAVANGIFQGNADGSFAPEGKVTRAEIATILCNWLSK